MGQTAEEREYLAYIHAASAIAILIATSPIPQGKRIEFITRVARANGRPVRHGSWVYTTEIGFMAGFHAERAR